MRLTIFALFIIFNLELYVQCHPALLNSRSFDALSTDHASNLEGYAIHRANSEDLDVLHESEAKRQKILGYKFNRRIARSTVDQPDNYESEHFDDQPERTEDQNESNSFPSNLARRFRRCAIWLRRIRNRYIRPALDALNNGSPIVFSTNSNHPNENRNDERYNYSYNHPTNDEATNDRTVEHHDSANNHLPESNTRETSVYRIPSTSSIAPFVESHNFVTPPNREAIVPSSSSPAPIETNDDWTHSPNE